MHLPTFLAALATIAAGSAIAAPSKLSKRASIDQHLFDEFSRFIKISQAAYSPICPRPVGMNKEFTINDRATSISGFVLKDDDQEEIIVAFQGTASIQDAMIDQDNELVSWTSPGSEGCEGCTVHAGFQKQWNSVAEDVLDFLESEVSDNPGYNLTVTGHSLGGALTSLAGISIEKAFPGKVTGYGFASPRVGNRKFAEYVDAAYGDRMYRVTHTDDNVPQDLMVEDGYYHVATEYWISDDPATPENIIKCNGGEDPECNAAHGEGGLGLTGINAAHFQYIISMIGIPECI